MMSNTALVWLPEISIPISCIASTTIGFNFPGSSPALCASNSSPQIWFRKASAIWLRALLWMQTNRTFFFIILRCGFGFQFGATIFFAHATAGEHRGDGAERRRGEINPQMLEMAGDERGCERTRWIHGRAANRPGEHRFERDDRADGDPRRYAFFLRAGRDVENRQHQKKCQDGFENKRLRFRTGGQR